MYRWVDHTGELELEIEAENETEVFEQGFEAMRDLLRPEEAALSAASERIRVSLTAGDRPALLADWLSELAFLAESEGFVPERVASIELDGNRLTAELLGVRGDPPHLVKAATYHRLALERDDSGWRAKVVLDV
jgi:SHS2 domain-containing protein